MKQRGVALLGVLLVVSLVTVLAVGLAHSNMLRLSLTERRAEAAQAWQTWRGGLEWARDILREDARRTRHDHLDEFWARGLRDYPAEGGYLSGIMEDQQGLFNLNNLVRNGQASPADLAMFGRLLSRLGLDPSLAAVAADWIDSDRAPLPGGAEDADYARLAPPYRAANRPILHPAELYRLRGFDAASVRRLLPFVTALPGATAINVNTAPAEVLAALLPELDAAQIGGLLKARPFAALTDLYATLPEGTQVGGTPAGVASQYFLLRLRVRHGAVRAEGEALLDRSAGLPRVLAQARGLDRPLRVDNPLGEAELRMDNR